MQYLNPRVCIQHLTTFNSVPWNQVSGRFKICLGFGSVGIEETETWHYFPFKPHGSIYVQC